MESPTLHIARYTGVGRSRFESLDRGLKGNCIQSLNDARLIGKTMGIWTEQESDFHLTSQCVNAK